MVVVIQKSMSLKYEPSSEPLHISKKNWWQVSPRLKARVCAFGEQMSTVLAVQILTDMDVKATLVQFSI